MDGGDALGVDSFVFEHGVHHERFDGGWGEVQSKENCHLNDYIYLPPLHTNNLLRYHYNCYWSVNWFDVFVFVFFFRFILISLFFSVSVLLHKCYIFTTILSQNNQKEYSLIHQKVDRFHRDKSVITVFSPLLTSLFHTSYPVLQITVIGSCSSVICNHETTIINDDNGKSSVATNRELLKYCMSGSTFIPARVAKKATHRNSHNSRSLFGYSDILYRFNL